MATREARSRSCCRSLTQFPERAHVVGAYGLGKSQRLIALLREAGYERPIYLHGALAACCELYESFGVELGALKPATGAKRESLQGEIVLAPPSAIADRWSRRLPDPAHRVCLGLDARARAGAAARRRAAAGDLRPCRLARADADNRRDRRARRCGSRMGARTRCCIISSHRARGPRAGARSVARTRSRVKHFAELLDRLAYTPSRNDKLRLLADYFARDARPRPRLGARGADRRAVLPAAAAPHLREMIEAAGRSGAVRPVARLCRRHRRDHRADLAASRGAREQAPRLDEVVRDARSAPCRARCRRLLAALLDGARCHRALGTAQARRPGARASASRRGSPRRARRMVRGRRSPRSRRSGTGFAPPYAELFAWLSGAGRAPDVGRTRDVPAADAVASDRGRELAVDRA